MCEHPQECFDEDGECKWCYDIVVQQQMYQALREQTSKNAIIIESGTVAIRCDSIGLLEARGGTVVFHDLKRDLQSTFNPQK